jgi:hypothetical protein
VVEREPRKQTKGEVKMTKLEKAVMEIVEAQEDKESFVQDVLTHGCQSGIVSDLIYYHQTHKFFDDHKEDIIELKREFDEMLGEPIHVEGDAKNWLAWFAFEETVRKLYEV